MTTDEIMALADALEWPFSGHELKQKAAAKLRRLHAENEAKDNLLRQAVTWLSLLCETAGLDPEGTTLEFSDRENNLPPLTVSVAGTIAAMRDRLNQSTN